MWSKAENAALQACKECKGNKNGLGHRMTQIAKQFQGMLWTFTAIWKETMSDEPLVNYDSKSDVLYIVTREGREERFVEIAPGINIELDEKDEVIGIEILNASKFLKPVAKPLYEHIQII